MNLLGVLKKKYKNALWQRGVKLRERQQLNMSIDIRLVGLLKRLAAEFTVPRDIVGEHALETGCYYLNRAMEDEEKTKILRQHLIGVHLIDSGVDDSESILRIGEGGDISKLLAQVEPVLRDWKAFKHALPIAKRTRNFAYVEKFEKQLLQSAVELASWIEKHHLDESVNNETIGDQQKDNDDSY